MGHSRRVVANEFDTKVRFTKLNLFAKFDLRLSYDGDN